MDFQIVLPGKTIAGKGALSRAGLEKYGKKPLIVTGKHTAKSQAAAELLKYATIVVSSLPLLIMYPFFQKYFDNGIMVGSIKG